MATISCFEEMEIWKLAREQANELFLLYTQGSFATDFELRNQVNASTGSVMDNIAEGFERSGNKEFFNFLIIAKAPMGKSGPNFVGHLIENIYHLKSLIF
jgi:hypothetical protein